MIVVNHLLVVYLLLIACGASRAPDVAPDLPEGWCKNGTPTRTTGECMCPGDCSGPRCHREQGFVWYSGLKCPTCECVKSGSGTRLEESNSNSESGSRGVQEWDSNSMTHVAKKWVVSNPAPVHQPARVEERAEPLQLSSDPWLVFMEFIEDHTLGVFVFCVLLVLLLTGSVMMILRNDTMAEERELKQSRAAKEKTENLENCGNTVKK